MAASKTNYLAGRPGTLGNLVQLGTPVQLLSVACPAGRSTDFPGPAAGAIRVVDLFISPVVSGSNATLVTVTLQPQNVNLKQSGTISGTQGIVRQVLAFGETLRYTSAGVNDAVMVGTYYDLPATWITVVRAPITNAFSVVIPTPAAGFQHRWLQLSAMNDSPSGPASNTQQIIQTRAMVSNLDTITHTLEQQLGGGVIARSVAMSQGSREQLTGIMQAPVTPSNGPMQYRTIAAIATTPLQILGAYETLPL